MTFTFNFLNREYGPKKLALYSIPLIANIYKKASINSYLPLLCGYCMNIFDDTEILKEALSPYPYEAKIILKNLCFIIPQTSLEHSKYTSVYDSVLYGLLCASVSLKISDKTEVEIKFNDVAYHAVLGFVQSSIRGYCVAKMLSMNMNPYLEFFLLPIAQSLIPAVSYVSFLNAYKWCAGDELISIEKTKDYALFSYKMNISFKTLGLGMSYISSLLQPTEAISELQTQGI